MIEIHKDALGNVSGYFDTVKNVWVPPPKLVSKEVEVEDDAPATDQDDTGEPVDYSTWTKDQLRHALDEAGVTFHKSATKDELVELLQAEAE